eukprot:767409-Hanusia_phi.AAC.3
MFRMTAKFISLSSSEFDGAWTEIRLRILLGDVHVTVTGLLQLPSSGLRTSEAHHKDEKVPQTMEANLPHRSDQSSERSQMQTSKELSWMSYNIGQRIRKLRGVNEGTKSVENATYASDELHSRRDRGAGRPATR